MKKIHPRIRQALCLMLALVMVLGMFPAIQVHAAEGTTLYLVPNSNWKNDNARFALLLERSRHQRLDRHGRSRRRRRLRGHRPGRL